MKYKFCSPLILLLICFYASHAQQPNIARLRISLLYDTSGNSSDFADACQVLFSDNFLKGIGPEDSYKLSNADENLALKNGSALLSIEGRPTLIQLDTVQLNITKYGQTAYFFSFIASNFTAPASALLIDNYLGTATLLDLTDTTITSFTLTADLASKAANRFYLVFKPCNQAVWTGSVSSDWHNSSNWCMGEVPAAAANVMIPANTTNNPVLNAPIVVNNLTLNSTLTLNGQMATINGIISGVTGTFTGSPTSKLFINGNAGNIRFTPGTAMLQVLQVNAGGVAIVEDNLVVTGP